MHPPLRYPDDTPQDSPRQESRDATPTTTVGHHRRTLAGATYRLATAVEGSPFQRSDCWKATCRDDWAPYLTVKVYLGLREGDPIYVSALCHGELVRPWQLGDEARAWLAGER